MSVVGVDLRMSRATGRHESVPSLAFAGALRCGGARAGFFRLSEALRKSFGLFSEFPRIGAFQFREVVQLPANSRQMLGMRDL